MVPAGIARAPAENQAEQKTARDYAASMEMMDQAYQTLAARMTLQQQLVLSHDQTVWLNTRDLGCNQPGVNADRCKFIMTETRINVMKKIMPKAEISRAAAAIAPPSRPAVGVPKLIKAAGTIAVVNHPVMPPISVKPNHSVTLSVAATAMPWIWNTAGINSPYAFGYPDGTPPTAVELSDLGVRPGKHIMIKYITGRITLGPGTPATDALGYTALAAQNNAGPAGKYPSFYMPAGAASLGALVGVFAKADGSIVGAPFAVGNGLAMVAVPPGASRLQLGINDDIFGAEDPASGNAGAFSVSVSAD